MAQTSDKLRFVNVGTGSSLRKIAVRHHVGSSPGIMWLGGFRSDMLGTKAEKIDEWAQQNGFMSTRHDYSGHGESGGEFTDGKISMWLEESLCVLDQVTQGPQILVGSSMGGWIALRMVEELAKQGRSNNIAGMVLIAPAPDFTHDLMRPSFTPEQEKALREKGYFAEPTPYSDEPNIITRALIEDGENNRVLDGMIEPGCPVHIIQGTDDPDVPYEHAMKLVSHMPSAEVVMTTIKDGDHRLSRDEDIATIIAAVAEMAKA